MLQAARAAPWPACIAWYHCVPVQVSQAGHVSLLLPGSCVRHTMPPACAGPLGAIFSVSTCPLGVGLLLVLLGVSPGFVPAALSVLSITNGGYLTDRLPGLCTCHLPAVSLPARCALPLVALCVALCAIPAMPGSLLPPSGTGAVWCAWCCCLLGFCRIGEFFSHTREQRGLRENPLKFLRVGDMLAYGLRLCVCVRLPALPPAPPCGRSFPPGYAPSVGGFFRASARFCLSCLAIAWATLPAISCVTLPPARDCLPLCVSYPGCLWSARLLWCFLYPLSISYT